MINFSFPAIAKRLYNESVRFFGDLSSISDDLNKLESQFNSSMDVQDLNVLGDETITGNLSVAGEVHNASAVYNTLTNTPAVSTILPSMIAEGIITVDVTAAVLVLSSLPDGSDLDTQFPNMEVGETISFMIYPFGNSLNSVQLVDGIDCTCFDSGVTNGRLITSPRTLLLRKTAASTYVVF